MSANPPTATPEDLRAARHQWFATAMRARQRGDWDAEAGAWEQLARSHYDDLDRLAHNPAPDADAVTTAGRLGEEYAQLAAGARQKRDQHAPAPTPAASTADALSQAFGLGQRYAGQLRREIAIIARNEAGSLLRRIL